MLCVGALPFFWLHEGRRDSRSARCGAYLHPSPWCTCAIPSHTCTPFCAVVIRCQTSSNAAVRPGVCAPARRTSLQFWANPNGRSHSWVLQSRAWCLLVVIRAPGDKVSGAQTGWLPSGVKVMCGGSMIGCAMLQTCNMVCLSQKTGHVRHGSCTVSMYSWLEPLLPAPQTAPHTNRAGSLGGVSSVLCC